MALHPSRLRRFLCTLLCCVPLLGMGVAHAQDADGSNSVSGSLSDSSSTSGLDSSFNGNASSLGTELQGGVSDQGNSALTGIGVDGQVSSTSVDGYVVSPYVQDTSDKLTAGSGGRSGGAGSAAFSGLDTSQAVSGFGIEGSRLAFSGGQTLAAMATENSPALGERRRTEEAETAASVAVDPVLTNDLGGYGEADLQLGSTLPLPSAEVSAAFASLPYEQPQYQYDDGQTALIGRVPEPGSLLQTSLVSTSTATGFSDSTLGQAGLPSEAQAFGSPIGLTFPYGKEGGSPFPAMADLFAPPQGVTVNLYALPQPSHYRDFELYEHYMFQRRVILGMDVAQAEQLRQNDLETFENERQSKLDEGIGSRDQAPSGTPQAPTIR